MVSPRRRIFSCLTFPESDLLASDFEANTFAIEDSDLRAFVGAGMLVPSIVLYGYSDDVAVVVTWIAIGNESFDDTGHAD
jgi:hypothetical protein